MYLAPLNYDRFFKKIFGNEKFAKAFLEDFLDISITEIEIMERKNFITDKSIPVEFDYRCKIDDDEFIIIEMQQWFKTDIIKRFYLYHTLSTSLQLETLEEKIISVDHKTGNIIKDKLYNDLKPAITLIWMVDDDLGFKEDSITYQMAVKQLNDFVKNDSLWAKSFDILFKEREKILKIENNDKKGLKFISKNELTFIFQKNIVKNIINRKDEKNYAKWFDFAFKTKNKNNIKDDFIKFENNKLFIDMMNILLKDKLTEEEIKYISKEDELKDAYTKYTSVLIDKQKEVDLAQIELGKLQKDKIRLQKEKDQVQKEKDQVQKEKDKVQKEKDNIIINMIKAKLDINQIAKITGASIKNIKELQTKQ